MKTKQVGRTVLAFDVETSGGSLTQSGLLSIGASLFDGVAIESKAFQVNIQLPEERSFELDKYGISHIKNHYIPFFS